MAISSSIGTSYLAAADRNSLFREVFVWARTRPLALPSKTAPASPPPLNLRKSRRSTPGLIPEVGFPAGAVPEHSEHTFPLLPWRGTRMLPTAKGLHKSKAPTGEERPPSGASVHLVVARQSAPCSYHDRKLRYASSRILIRTPNILWQSARTRAEPQASSGATRSGLCSISYAIFRESPSHALR